MVDNSKALSTSSVASHWIRANAGSGKTYVLTREVVKLLLLGVAPERICCITYTKAAAGEMRARIIGLLRSLLLADDAACRREVESITGQAPTAAILQRVRLLFGMVLDSPVGGIQLTTIHGFCQQLLRAFPLEAGLAPHFTVADDAQTAQLIAQVKHRLLASPLAIDGPLADAIGLLAQRSGEMRFDTLVKTMLNDREAWRQAWAGQDEASYRARLYAALGVAADATPATLIAQAMDYLSDAEIAHLRGCIATLQADKTAYKRALGDGLDAWLAQPRAGWGAHYAAWRELWFTDKGLGTPRVHLTKWAEKGDDAVLAGCIQRSMAQVAGLNGALASLALAEESMAAALLARQLLDLYDQVKSERSVLDYHDLITRTRELLTTRGMVGWVMSKLDHRIDHLLIDEAQDTSSEQWRIAQVLVDELVATTGGMGSTNVPRSLFVVGDEKQSIFSFQGAAPDLYASKETDFARLLAHSNAPLQARTLHASYRSVPAVLAAVDAVARDATVASALSAAGEPPLHQAIRAQSPGCVVVHTPIVAEEKQAVVPFTIPTEYSIARTPAQMLAERVSATVRQWLDDKQYNAGDILILTRNRHPIVLPLLRALQRAGIAVAGIDRLVLADHLAVKDLLALMRWCTSPHDDLALAQVLRSPLIGWSDAQLYVLAQPRGAVRLWDALADFPETVLLNNWRANAHATPYEFLTQLLEVDGRRHQFARRFGEEIHEILDELKEQSVAMPHGTAPTLANFAAWVSGSDRHIKREMDSAHRDQVRVMTVHGAKGLEAPVVLMVDTVGLPNASKELFSSVTSEAGQVFPLLALTDEARLSSDWQQGRALQKQAQLAEYYRLMYVAMTRPRDALHVFAVAPARGELKPECWYETIRRGVLTLPQATQEADGTVRIDDAGYSPQASAPASPMALTVPDWAKTPAPKVPTTPVLSPSRLQTPALAPFEGQRGGRARERGVRLHRVLQFVQASTTDEQLHQLIAHVSPDWTLDQRQQAHAEISALLTQYRWLWEYPSRSEVNICGTVTLEGVDYPVLGQIDKLVETDDCVIVIDYKTGSHVPENDQEISEAYLLQLKLYVALLETLYPTKRVRPALLWTANARISWLDEAVANILWNRVQAGISP